MHGDAMMIFVIGVREPHIDELNVRIKHGGLGLGMRLHNNMVHPSPTHYNIIIAICIAHLCTRDCGACMRKLISKHHCHILYSPSVKSFLVWICRRQENDRGHARERAHCTSKTNFKAEQRKRG